MKITFLGATSEVTGSNYLLEHDGVKILIDCGLFQSGRFSDQKNYQPFKFNPAEIDCVILTHAHIDHSGRIPVLVKQGQGFQGEIYGTSPTLDFVEILLSDSLRILEKEARYHDRDPVYNEANVAKAVSLFKKVEYNNEISISQNLSFILRDAGHILGSAIIEIFYSKGDGPKKKAVFSGDLGNYPNPMLKRTTEVDQADYLVMESTYGGHQHEDIESRAKILKKVITETINNGGVLMVPAFAIERTQELLREINELVEKKQIPRVPIFLDSPLAIKVTDIYKQFQRYFNEEVKKVIKSGDDIFQFPGLNFCLTPEQSKRINSIPAPKIIIAGSGMSNGGRIIHHERRYLSDPKNTLLIIGYQAAGTLGRKIIDGAERVEILGEAIKVRAQIKKIGGYSAHADQDKLIDWVRPMKQSVKKVFLVHGEPDSMQILATKIKKELALEPIIPNFGESFELD
ncbi:MBL fold metallo-hydrolase [Candidatus Azambacteria bacterium]|nr:MBL fold metallo-hydrolase [Candidatus Azambacteria bacterium]